MQDRAVSEGVVATLRSGGGNFGTRGYDEGHLSFPISRKNGKIIIIIIIAIMV